ncbi:MAG TPA: SDR family NAD(P)-dependent oxidoreductase, partial [Propionibacteriaceae bacterium]|nr:SDR family NAD(P)-dependent oxidoreductase [Propionibacteriaceae bacterium]
MGLLEGKKIVILGASSGIGWRTAEVFAEHGAQIVVAARRVDRLERLAASVGGVARACDITDHDDVKSLVDFSVDALGGLDGAINSAGLNRPSLIRDITPELLEEIT